MSAESPMLGLRLSTDPRWVKLVESNISEILTDHAWCEQKAASNAISTIVRYPELTDLVEALTEIAQEEMEHFGMSSSASKSGGSHWGTSAKTTTSQTWPNSSSAGAPGKSSSLIACYSPP